MAQNRSRYCTFVASFIITIIAIPSIIYGPILIITGEMPPPRVSSSISLDYKANWLREKVADGRCDVLVLGSSMALNNFSPREFAKIYPGKVINLGAWGLSITNDYDMLKLIIEKCSPKLIIFPLYYRDFSSDGQKADWTSLARVVKGDNYAFTYLRTLDPIHVVEEALKAHERRKHGNRIFDSLQFDDSGTVNLSASNFNRVDQRWEGYKQLPVAAPSQKDMDSLSRIMILARKNNTNVLVATVPLCKAASNYLDIVAMENLWSAVAEIVLTGGGQFLRIDSGARFPDEFYSDFSHFNERGAAVWTRIIVEHLTDKTASLLLIEHGQSNTTVVAEEPAPTNGSGLRNN